MLHTALDAVSGVFTAGFVVIVNDDVAAEQAGSGCETRGWGARWSTIDGPGSECQRLQAAGRKDSCWGTSREVFVVVVAVNNIDSCDDDGDGDDDGEGLLGV